MTDDITDESSTSLNEESTTSLDDALNGVADESEVKGGAEEPKPAAEPEVKPEEGAKEKEEAAAPPNVTAKQVEAFKRKAIDATKRAQAAEQALQAAQPQPKAVDVFEDQQGYTNQILGSVNQAVLNERINGSEYRATKKYPDLSDKVDKFIELKTANPALQQELLAHQDPYEFIVETVKNAEDFEQMKDADGYKARITAEIEKDLKAKHYAEFQAGKTLEESIPPSMASQNSKGSLSGAEYSGPTPLDNIVGPGAQP